MTRRLNHREATSSSDLPGKPARRTISARESMQQPTRMSKIERRGYGDALTNFGNRKAVPKVERSLIGRGQLKTWIVRMRPSSEKGSQMRRQEFGHKAMPILCASKVESELHETRRCLLRAPRGLACKVFLHCQCSEALAGTPFGHWRQRFAAHESCSRITWGGGSESRKLSGF